ncbi:MAG: HIT domain-containing protein [Desulfobacterales bacterium]|nr:HIT domain-containing protein [Desulfobacterales bacterium]
MFNNAPKDYDCPFCLFVKGIQRRPVCSCRSDIVYEDERTMAFICSHQWPNNKGHVLIIPKAHHENIYDLPDSLAADIHALARQIAIAMKSAYLCDGVSTRQHNEPCGDQEVWHYHLHVFPRFENDCLYDIPYGHIMPTDQRAGYATLLKVFLNKRLDKRSHGIRPDKENQTNRYLRVPKNK